METQKARIVLKAENPPEQSHRSKYRDAIEAARVKFKPGQWFLLVEMSKVGSAAGTIYGLRHKFGDFEFKQSGTKIYARRTE